MKFIDLFAGIGGFHAGLVQVGHECVGAIEIEKHARAIYRHHYPNVSLWRDVRQVDPDTLPDFDLLSGGFPCQSFSVAGKRLGLDDTRGTLFFEIMRLARQKRPRYLLLENVVGLLNNDGGRTFATILKTMDELGYNAGWQVLYGEDWLPQTRHRLFIVGSLRGSGAQEVLPVRDSQEGHYTAPSPHKTSNTVRTKNRQRENLLVDTPPTDKAYVYPNDPLVPKQLVGGGQAQRIYDTSGAAVALKSCSGGQGGKTGLYTPETRELSVDMPVRTLTPTECERLQGFPDGYTATGTDDKGQEYDVIDSHRIRCLGNSVMVPVVKFLGELLCE